MGAPLRISFGLPFVDAIKSALRRRPILPEAYYAAAAASARRIAWTVSGVAGLAQIRAVLDSLNAAQAAGVGMGEWKKTIKPLQLGLPRHRLELIWRMHAQTAYNAGHWRNFDEQARRRPWLMYSAIDDERTRPAHRALDGHIAPVYDTFWETHSPPLGFNCRCSLISLTTVQAEARGLNRQSYEKPRVQADEGFEPPPQQAERSIRAYFSDAAIAMGQLFAAAAAAWLIATPGLTREEEEALAELLR